MADSVTYTTTYHCFIQTSENESCLPRWHILLRVSLANNDDIIFTNFSQNLLLGLICCLFASLPADSQRTNISTEKGMASKNDPFQFQEFDEAGTLLESNRDAVTISIDDEDLKSKRQRSAVGFAQDVGDEEPLISEDREELLSGKNKNAPFWTFEYYQKFFDIETHHVRERILGSLVPWPGKNFIQVHLRKNPDLYGPFWICTTLVFAIAISGNLSTFLRYFGNSNYKYTAEFGKVSIAATAIFSYAWLVPLGLWGLLLWRSNKILNLVSYSFMEIVCVYGYSLAVYIPAVVLWIPHVEWLRWLSIVVALCLSSSVLVMTFWPALRDDHPKVIIATVAGIVLLNGLLAVGCKMYFFSEAKLGPGHVSPPAAIITNGTSS